jgi:hypothetical protein
VLSGKTGRAEADRLVAAARAGGGGARGRSRGPDAVAASLAEVVAALD